MRWSNKLNMHKLLISIFLIVFGIAGIYAADNYFINYLSLQSADPTVCIENGVSGTAAITDPYLNKTTAIDISYYPLDAGSGFIVTNDGYIITAFHVISDPQALKKDGTLKEMDSDDIQLYVEQATVKEYLSKYNSQLGNELIDNGTTNHANLSQNISFLTDLMVQKRLISVKSGKQTIKVYIKTSSRVASLNAALIDVGNSTSDDDIALLKLNSASNLHFLNISSQKLSIGENITVYGYPDNKIQTQSVIPSTVTGNVTSTNSNLFGTAYYKTNAITAQGYSGGPVLNSKNQVVGMLVYGIENVESSKPQVQSSLFLSSKYIIKICSKNNVSIAISN